MIEIVGRLFHSGCSHQICWKMSDVPFDGFLGNHSTGGMDFVVLGFKSHAVKVSGLRLV